jgi:hypothetical protein
MFWSLDGLLCHAAGHLRPALADRAALARARALLGRLPAALSDWVHLEARLRGPASRLDVIVRVDARGRSVLTEACATAHPARHLAPALRALPAWSRAERFCHAWSDPASTLHRSIESLWLEFDLDDRDRDSHPRFFADLGASARRQLAGDDLVRLVCDVQASLAERPLAPRTLRLLRHCLASAPPRASVLSVGLPHDDRGERLRLCFVGLADSQIDGYLRAIGWCPGRREADATRARLASLAGAFRRPDAAISMIHVDLDGGAIGPRVGLELAFARRPQFSAAVAERGALEWLTTGLACDRSRCDALLAWPGCSRVTLPHELWPSVMVRRLNHVKVVVDPVAQDIDVKAYLCAYRPGGRIAREASAPRSAMPWSQSPASIQ